MDGDATGIVTTVLKSLEPFDQHGNDVARADRADDATHTDPLLEARDHHATQTNATKDCEKRIDSAKLNHQRDMLQETPDPGLAMMKNSQRASLDMTDLRILRQLQQDATLTNQALAVAALTSPATCLRRVKRLVAAGVIERQVALLNTEGLWPSLTVIAEVTLDRQGEEHLRAFEARAIAYSAVQQCYQVSPGPDFVLILTVADMAAWASVRADLFTQDANVRNIKTYFAVTTAKFEASPPIDLTQAA